MTLLIDDDHKYNLYDKVFKKNYSYLVNTLVHLIAQRDFFYVQFQNTLPL